MESTQNDNPGSDIQLAEVLELEAARNARPGEKGPDLVQKVAVLTGLPEDFAKEELSKILEQTGHSEHNLTLDQLRSALIAYLESLGEDFLTDPDPNSEAPH